MFSLESSNVTTGGSSLSIINISTPELSSIFAFIGVPKPTIIVSSSSYDSSSIVDIRIEPVICPASIFI